MERVRLRPAVLGTALAALLLLPFAVPDANAGHNSVALQVGPYDASLSIQPAIVSGRENTSVIVQNRGAANAAIAMDIYTPGGLLVSAAGQIYTNVPPGGTRWFAQAHNTGLAINFRGVGVVSSDNPFNALLVRDILSSSGKSYSILNAYPTGGNKVTLPLVMNNVSGRHTRFTIANAGTAVACVSLQYAFAGGGSTSATGPGGSGCGSTAYPIPVGGQVSFAPSSIDGALPMPAATAGRVMSVNISSDNPVTATVDAYQAGGSRKLGSYDGFVVGAPGSTTDGVGTEIAIPIALKSVDGWYSQILLSNPNGAAATATITYRGTVYGQPATYAVPITVPATGIAAHSVYDGNTIPIEFFGTATVTSNLPLAAVVFRMKMSWSGSYIEQHPYTAVSGVPTDRASTKVRLPLIFRRVYATGGYSGFNSWVSVSVVGGGTANLTIEAIPDPTAPTCGSGSPQTVTKVIQGSFIFYQNSNSAGSTGNNGFQSTPGCFWGGMTITSDVPIIAVANVTSDLYVGDNDALYNGFAE